MREDVESDFVDGSVACGASRLQWLAAGRGDLVVDLVTGAPTRFHRLLAKQFHAVALDVPNADAIASKRFAASLREVASASGHERCSLIIRGAELPLAQQVLEESEGLVVSLVLMAPLPSEDTAALDALSAAALPLLVLSGTRGNLSPPEAGSRFRARIRTSHYILVYDAGDTIETDRPEATASVVREFLAHRERFIVSQASGLIHP